MEKKEFISFILSVFVFFIHISSIGQYADSGSFISEVNERYSFFFQESITRFAVPMFFVLSGIAFFKDYNNKKYFNKIKSRIFSLVIPYLLWNTLWTVFEIVCSYSFISKYFVGRQPFTLTFINVLKGIFFYECNGPFWFVFNLIVFSFAAPLIYFIIRNKYIGIASAVLLTVLLPFGVRIPSSVFYSSTSIIFYLIGAIIGKHFFEYTQIKSTNSIRLFSILFLAAYIILKNIFGVWENLYAKAVLEVAVFTLASYSLWNITDLFIDKVKPRTIYSRSFAIYALHINVSAIIAKIIFLLLPKSEWFAIPNFIVTTVLTLLFINLICFVLEKFCPRIYSILMGNRLKRNKKA